MKIIILSGFLGSGKTTLLMGMTAYLSRLHDDKAPAHIDLAIIENEIGAVNIDDYALAGAGYEVFGMTAGCICCTMVSDLTECVRDVSERIRPDWLIVEATGLAYPQSIAKAVKEYAGFDASIVCIVDAARFDAFLQAMPPLAEGQLAAADLLLVNKTDAVSSEKLASVRRLVSERCPDTELLLLSMKDGVDEAVIRRVLYGA